MKLFFLSYIYQRKKDQYERKEDKNLSYILSPASDWNNCKTISFEAEVKSIKAKMDSISGVYDDLNEKMHDVDKTM